ncbi:MAG: CRISPR system precrRNA processing endoribonuclease RAMP protein Cas6 [Candidatus Viridilinea halotolerans]|uniref:CRISPR system precrRNA processing endoribonuclease RAMP protein Cas6 n=1 Tax=Candidatus Viridilinea halotolerans TaxID=2491704 RepID=A0A426TUA0_9CHLR|nr:MAG: CRISPR system precrRNA processing endoribonuclease RAMP protein Cas6 [Candidatus Viridilinea halotolerans]
MPSAFIYHLRPTAAVRVPSDLGRAGHAMLLAIIAAHNPDLAERLHSANEQRPMTISNPLGRVAASDKGVVIDPKRTYPLRITLLNDIMEQAAHAWREAPAATLHLGGATWQIERIASQSRDDPWVGRESYGSLIKRGVERAGQGPGRWSFTFDSPVSFRQRGMCQALPLPELVFGSLLDRWNALAPFPLPGEVRRYAAEALMVSRFELRTAIVMSKGGTPQVGVVGHCSYIALEDDPAMGGCIETLAHFALYSGIGAGTARGLGQARILASGMRGRNEATRQRTSAPLGPLA